MKRRMAIRTQRELISDLLNELFPFGLTDDCPARKKRT